MSTGLTEDDMRRALGLDVPPTPAAPEPVPEPKPEPEPEEIVFVTPVAPKPASPAPRIKRPSPALRVTLRCTRVFEGEETLFVHDAKTLSTIDAEQEARKAAAKEKFKYIDVVSVKRVE